jgi:hypothetical protein
MVKWKTAEMEADGQNHGGSGDGSMFTCPRCERHFHRSFLERHWSEWSQICWSPENEGFRQDCKLFRRTSHMGLARALHDSERAFDPADTGAEPTQAATLVGACVGYCALCGDHNRIAIVTSECVLSRCLGCRDAAVLRAPPPWCRLARLWPATHSVGADRIE